MIEIQCTSCHTRYRIDERVLPADSPTFKCSRCGHVFTADPGPAKKAATDTSSKPPSPRVATPRGEPKPEAAATSAPAPKALPESPKPAASEELSAVLKPSGAPEPKPAPVKPYIRNQRPTVFDRKPEPSAQKKAAEPDAEIDADAIARMKASMGAAPKQDAEPAATPSARASEASPAANEEADSQGENLEFDFNDESEPQLGGDSDDDSAAPEQWSVGDVAVDDQQPSRKSAFGSGGLDPGFSRGEPAPIGRGTIPQYAGRPPMQRSPLPDEREFVERAGMHSARSFIGLFFVVALMFVVFTLVIYGIPNASADLLRHVPVIGPEFVQPTPLENMVSVSDVQSSYQRVKGGHDALVLTGMVKNNSAVPLHTVQIGVRLLNAAQETVASSAVFVGTTVSPHMLGEMTPHELEFLQKLDPQKNFVLEPNHAAPFLMVFIDPPHDLNHFAVAIAKAEPVATAPEQDTNAH